ncbi:hypothetical protein JCM8097_006010 [Rhodosporidiobolus ruineniae]
MSGRGGGRGGRGGGRGGGASGRPQPPVGHLNYNDIIEISKQGTDVLYPPMEMPDTEYPNEREAKIAKRYNSMVSEMRFTPYWLNAPTRASTDIERWSDRFKPKGSSSATALAALRDVHKARQWDRDLLPPSVFEAVLEKKLKGKAGTKNGARKASANIGALLEGDDDQLPEENSEEENDDEEPLEEEDEDDDGDNDYEAEYFDNGEEDDFDGLGGGGGGGDDDGGIMD